MGRSLNIFFNNGCLSIRYHLFIEIFPQHYKGYLKKYRLTKGGGGDMRKKKKIC